MTIGRQSIYRALDLGEFRAAATRRGDEGWVGTFFSRSPALTTAVTFNTLTGEYAVAARRGPVFFCSG